MTHPAIRDVGDKAFNDGFVGATKDYSGLVWFEKFAYWLNYREGVRVRRTWKNT